MYRHINTFKGGTRVLRQYLCLWVRKQLFLKSMFLFIQTVKQLSKTWVLEKILILLNVWILVKLVWKFWYIGWFTKTILGGQLNKLKLEVYCLISIQNIFSFGCSLSVSFPHIITFVASLKISFLTYSDKWIQNSKLYWNSTWYKWTHTIEKIVIIDRWLKMQKLLGR